MIKETIEVEITNINVDSKYFSFDYVVRRNGIFVEKNDYSSSHSWRENFESLRKKLEDGYAVELVIATVF